MININEEKGNLHPLTLFKELAKHFNVTEEDFEYLSLAGGEHIYFQIVKRIIPDDIYDTIEKLLEYTRKNTQDHISFRYAEINHHLLVDYCVSNKGNEMLTLKKVIGTINDTEYYAGKSYLDESILSSLYYDDFSSCTEPLIIYDQGKIYSFGRKKISMYPISMTNIFYYQNKKNIEYEVFKVIMECYGRDYPIWRDLAKDFEEGCPYASIPLDEIFACNTRRELIERRYGEEYASKRTNRETIGQGIFLARAARIVNENELQKLYSYTCPPMKIGRSKTDLAVPIADYVLQTLPKPIEYESYIRQDVIDIVRMSCQLRKKVPITYKSVNGIGEKHHELSVIQRRRQLPLVIFPKDSQFANLNMPDCCKRLTTRKAFVEEGERQNNCVASYIYEVNQDICSIWTADYMGQHITIEIRYIEKFDMYFVNQIFAANNCQTKECKKLYAIINDTINSKSKKATT